MLNKNHKITRKMFIDTLIVLIIAELTGALSCLIDGILTGRILGNEALAAAGFTGSYFAIISIVNGILMVGNQTLCVKAISKGDKNAANKIMSLSILIGIFATLFISSLVFIFTDQVAVIFGADKNDSVLMNNLTSYLKGVCFGSPFWCGLVVLTPIIQLDGGGQRAKVAAVVTALSDVVFDILLGGVLKLGMLGMGIATALSHFCGCLVTILHFFTKKATYKFSFKDMPFKQIGELCKEGLPRAVSMLARAIGPILLNIIVINISIDSSNALVALAVQRNISFCVMSIGWGVCGTTLMLGQLFYNAKNMTEMKSLIKLSLFIIGVVVGIFSIVLVFMAPLIVKLFVSDWSSNLELFNLAQISIRYFVLSLPFVAFNVSFASYVQAVGKNVLANIINAFIECVSLVIACFALSITQDYIGFFGGFLIGEFALSMLLILYTLINYLVNKKNPYSLYFIKPGYINDKDIILEASLNTYEDIEKFSIQTHELAKKSHLNASQAYRTALCAEELATNVFIHGFTKDNKKHIVEMRIVISETNAVITLLDDCVQFDISKKLKSWEIDKEHPEKNLGIRTIMLTASKVIYSNNMKINNLQVII